jgi:alpha-tubulin suppressor-like RCC1 family protein
MNKLIFTRFMLFFFSMAMSNAFAQIQAQEWPTSTAAASTEFSPVASVFDKNLGSIWSSNGYSDPLHNEYFFLNYGSTLKQINFIKIFPRIYNGTSLGFPKDFGIYWFDGAQWQLSKSFVNFPTPKNSEYIILPLPQTVNASAIGILATKLGQDNLGGYYFQIAEASAGLMPTSQTTDTLSAGLNFYCALTAYNGVKCWGNNRFGQIGNGSTGGATQTIEVIGLANNVRAIASGFYHNCALMYNGTINCWGTNSSGQLGNGLSGGYSSTPVQVSNINDAIGISVGSNHSCALLSAGNVKCWGSNSNGQLGDGTTGNNKATPVSVLNVGNGTTIAAGGLHTCVSTTTKVVQCWGSNYFGQLGNGYFRVDSPKKVDVSLIGDISAVTAGSAHTCAKTYAGTVKCWGYNLYGQLGNNTTTDALIPVTVSGISSGVQTISASSNSHSSGVVFSNGTSSAWGNNNLGQLGDGNKNGAQKVPVSVLNSPGYVSAIAIGNNSGCVRVDTGIRCFGYNDQGQLGNGTLNPSLTPVNVIGFP